MRTLLERFQEKFTIEPISGCWIWQAASVRGGYGSIGIARSRAMSAHRVSWILFRGPIPLGLGVLHRCDIPACVNPDHLFLGTPRDNALDREHKGRGPDNRGSANGKAKLTEEIVKRILSDSRPAPYIARELGVAHTTISAVRQRAVWGHVDGAAKKSTGNSGIYHAKAKLTPEQVNAIKISEGLGYRKLAKQYGVDRTTIRDIKKNHTWRAE